MTKIRDHKVLILTERPFVQRQWSAMFAPECSGSLIPTGTSTRVLNRKRAATGSQCSELTSRVVWEKLGKLNTRRAAEFIISCRDLVVDGVAVVQAGGDKHLSHLSDIIQEDSNHGLKNYITAKTSLTQTQ